MATKREAVAQLRAEDFKLLADAAEAGGGTRGQAVGLKLELGADQQRRLRRVVKILRSVKAAK